MGTATFVLATRTRKDREAAEKPARRWISGFTLSLLLASPFAIRVERATGEGIPGVVLSYSVEGCYLPTFASFSHCPTDEEYGGFDTGPTLLVLVMVTTGSDGTATAPAFRAGHPTPAHQPFEFKVEPYVSTQTTPAGFIISLEDTTHPIGGYQAASTTVRIVGGGSIVEVPALGSSGLALLARCSPQPPHGGCVLARDPPIVTGRARCPARRARVSIPPPLPARLSFAMIHKTGLPSGPSIGIHQTGGRPYGGRW